MSCIQKPNGFDFCQKKHIKIQNPGNTYLNTEPRKHRYYKKIEISKFHQ